MTRRYAASSALGSRACFARKRANAAAAARSAPLSSTATAARNSSAGSAPSIGAAGEAGDVLRADAAGADAAVRLRCGGLVVGDRPGAGEGGVGGSGAQVWARPIATGG